MPSADLQCMLDDPLGYRNYWSAEYLNAFPDDGVARFCARAADMIVPSLPSTLSCHRGAVGRGPADYPLRWRQSTWIIHPSGLWEEPTADERPRQWARALRAGLKPWSSSAVYLNFIGDEVQDRVMAGFRPENYTRQAKVKAQYDPDNDFQLNHNIKPA